MLGLFVLGILALWLWFAIWAGGAISNRIFKRDSQQPSQQPSQDGAQNHRIVRFTTQVLMTLFVLLLPFMDQLIAYPKWQQLCATTGDFEWGPSMDEKKAFGRDIVFVSERVTTTTIFPNIRIDYTGFYIYDAKTKELIFKKPHYKYSAEALFYIPSDSGNKTALFLQSCENYTFMTQKDSLLKTLQLNQLEYKAVLK